MSRPPGFDKAQVLEQVERQFRKSGYSGTSLDDLCAVTGLGRGSLYAAFGDKHTLFLQALDGYCGRSESILLASLDGPDDEALDRLRSFLTSSAHIVFADSDGLGCMAGKFAVELAGQDDAVALRIKHNLDLIQDALVGCITAAQRNGDLEPAAPSRDLASLFMTVARGIDVLTQAGAEIADMEGAADRAFAVLPLTEAARRRLAVPA
jgi:TetR/AcrR family transcriptional repressor of nem operon